MTGAPLDIIIVNFNTREALGACLRSLHAHPPARPHTVVVVDNASNDGSPEMVASEWPSAQVHRLDRNVGFGAANNIGAARSTSPLVLFLNSDTVVPKGAIDALCDRLDATGAWAAGPRLVDGRGRPEVSYGRMLSPWTEVLQGARVMLAARDAAWSRAYINARVSREREVDWVSGACLLVRRFAFDAAGGFDARFFMYEEDVDLCATLRAQGGRVLFTPRATITHLRGLSPGGPRHAGPSAYDTSHVAFYAKHAPRWVPWLRAWQRFRGRR